MHEMNGFLRQLIPTFVLALLFGLTLWQKLRGRRRIPWAVPFVFGVVLAVAVLIFVRQASSINRLQHLDAVEISSVTYRGETYRDRGQIRVVVTALNQAKWWSSRSADMLQHDPFSLHFTDGSDWEMLVGSNRYGSGTIIRMADREFSRGYAWSPTLHETLSTVLH
jgi:hypothetical protein